MTSPPRNHSPKRRALHERSDSHTNSVISPTLRIVNTDDSEAYIYSSNPYPSQPSHILSPSHGQGFLFEEDEPVSDKVTTTKPFASSPPKSRKWKGKGKGKVLTKRTNYPSDPASPSNFDGPSSPSRPEHSQLSTPASSSPTRQQDIVDLSRDPEGRVSDEIIQLPSIPEPGTPACSTYSPAWSSSASDLPEIQPTVRMSSKPSEDSISSSATTGTVQRHRPRDRSSRASYSAFPPLDRPSSSRSARSASAPLATTVDRFGNPLPSTSERHPLPGGRRISSVPSHADLQAAINSGANVQYPVVQPPAVSGSWAETTLTIPRRPTRTNEQDAARRWNPHLSTVHSESTDEGGDDRRSFPLQGAGTASVSSPVVVGSQSGISGPLAPPRALFPRNRDGTGSTIRVVNEDDDRPTEPPSRPLRSRGSGIRSILSTSSVKRKSLKAGEVRTELGSRGSFLRDSIPAWARIHYARGSESSFPSPPGSSEGAGRSQRNASPVTENCPSNIHRPRNRPHEVDVPHRSSMEITPAQNAPQVQETVEVRGPPWQSVTEIWSPRLQHDKRAVKRSVWRAPSLDEKLEDSLLSRRNRQVIMFVVGFTLPFAWMIASFLPLPPKPALSREKATGRSDVEQAMDQNLGPIDAARYENARWWRDVNRIMSIIGLLILATIIALAVVAARTQDL